MQTTLQGPPPITLVVRRAPHARRISLRVSGRDGRVTLSVPPGASMAEAMGFARAREPWLRRVLAAAPARSRPAPGATLQVEGQALPIVAAAVRSATRSGDTLRVPHDRDAGPPLARYLKRLARVRGEAAVARHARTLGLAPPPLSLRDTRSRWGSCNSAGRVMLSWRLVMAPPEILDYVAAHEVAHLVHLDHSPRFWAVAERLFPDWRRARTWLRAHGAELQSVDFS